MLACSFLILFVINPDVAVIDAASPSNATTTATIIMAAIELVELNIIFLGSYI